MIVLDTDYVSLWLRGNLTVRSKVTQPSFSVVITVIWSARDFQWMGRVINNLPIQSNLPAEHENLWQSIEFIRNFPVLKFDQNADNCYVQMLQANPPLRKKRLRQDLRIAAIAFSTNATSHYSQPSRL